MTTPTPTSLILNRAAGLLDSVAEADLVLANPAIALRCATSLGHLRTAGAVPDPVPVASYPPEAAARVEKALRLLSSLPAALFNTDDILDAVHEAMLAHESTG